MQKRLECDGPDSRTFGAPRFEGKYGTAVVVATVILLLFGACAVEAAQGSSGEVESAGSPPGTVMAAGSGRQTAAALDDQGRIHLLVADDAASVKSRAGLLHSWWLPGMTGAAARGAGSISAAGGDDAVAVHPVLFRSADGTALRAGWVERIDAGSMLRVSTWDTTTKAWSRPEAVIAGPTDLVRFPDGEGDWLTWVESVLFSDDILIARRGPDGWEKPVIISLRDRTEDLSPRLALDQGGDPWVVWAGSVDGSPDDILLSRRRNGKWILEQRVNTADDSPDVLPDLAVSSSGRICAVWLGFSRTTKHYEVTVSLSRDGVEWSPEQILGSGTFSGPPRIFPLDDGGFLVVWNDGRGRMWKSVLRQDRWTSPARISLNQSISAAILTIGPDGDVAGLRVPGPVPPGK